METKTTATTTTTTVHTSASPGVTLNLHYFTGTIPGWIKLIQILFAIICMGCASPVVTNYTHFFMFVVATSFIVTVLLCFIYLFSVQELLTNLPWLMLELAYTAGTVILYGIATIVQLAMTSGSSYYYSLKYWRFYDAYITAGCFGLFNVLAYGAGLYFLFRDYRQSRQVVN